jgi:hypothetical protein
MIAAISSLLSTCGHCSDKLNPVMANIKCYIICYKIIIEDKPPVSLLCLLILGSTALQEPWILLQQVPILLYYLKFASISSLSAPLINFQHLPVV